tara:strand:+ start:232 stop:651 length:420 start_codon:yes stop_codon:yes gene_type:complete
MANKKKPAKKSAKKTESKAKETKKKPLESLSQVHGKEEKFEPTTLDQVWGESGNTKYGTTDVNDYVRKLEGMNTTDLQTHAHVIGFVPVDDRVTLTKKLIGEFKKHVSSFKKPANQPNSNQNISKNVPDSVKRTLAEGR